MTQILMSVRVVTSHVIITQSVRTLQAATSVTAGLDTLAAEWCALILMSVWMIHVIWMQLVAILMGVITASVTVDL